MRKPKTRQQNQRDLRSETIFAQRWLELLIQRQFDKEMPEARRTEQALLLRCVANLLRTDYIRTFCTALEIAEDDLTKGVEEVARKVDEAFPEVAKMSHADFRSLEELIREAEPALPFGGFSASRRRSNTRKAQRLLHKT
jgi:hypothetical protein